MVDLFFLQSYFTASSESLAVEDCSSGAYSSQATGENDRRPDTGNIEEAESSLRENGSLNFEEARALLGRYEYQKGNIEAALHVFEGIDIATVTPKMKISLSQRGEPRRRVSHNYGDPPLSIHAVGLLLEAILFHTSGQKKKKKNKPVCCDVEDEGDGGWAVKSATTSSKERRPPAARSGEQQQQRRRPAAAATATKILPVFNTFDAKKE
ncbi:protein NPGR2-like [Lactuca sativa]|uniref:protein NPGR2-like n=1 Tax=Lactuca sativa TaxID=4236 RepID=UPI0022AE73BB|nr:protein NPGR2-like [Lactuca sativa]